MQQGLLAGGLADGSVVLWDPAAIVERKEGVSPLLAKMQKHKGEASPMGLCKHPDRYGRTCRALV